MHPNSSESRERERMMRLSRLAQEYVHATMSNDNTDKWLEIAEQVADTDLVMFHELVCEFRKGKA